MNNNEVSLTSTVNVKVMKESTSSTNARSPLVVSFPNGVPSITKSSPLFTWSKEKTKSVSGTTSGKRIHGQDSTCNYASQFLTSSESDQSSKRKRNIKPTTKIMLGIFDKETNSLTLHVSAEDGKIVSLLQTIKPHRRRNQQYGDDDDSEYSHDEHTEHLSLRHLSETEKRRVLFDSFGSTKKKKVLKSREANKVHASSIVGSDMNMLDAVNQQNMSKSNVEGMKEATQNIIEKTEKLNAIEKSYAEARKAFLPPFDMNAELPHQIYDAQRICNEASWSKISQIVDACLYKAQDENGGNIESERWVANLTSRGGRWSKPVLEIFKTIQDPSHHKYRIKCILLLQYMTHFYLYFARDKYATIKNISVDKLAGRMRLPYEVIPHLLSLFTTQLQDTRASSTTNSDASEGLNATYTMDKPHKNKCLAYILLVYIMTHGKEMKVGSINSMAKALQLELNIASNLLRQSGCTVAKKAGGTYAVSLNAPLKFPVSKKLKRRNVV